jgi:hypothetical protein
MRESAHTPGSVEAGALALQRVLALEGRNALARVELAASELERFEMTPAVVQRLGAIREAVLELDSLLDRIERLADPLRNPGRSARCEIAGVWTSVRRRVGPSLAARGIDLEPVVEGGARPLALAANLLERVVLLWLRLGLAGVDADSARTDPPRLVLGLVCAIEGDALLATLVGRRSGTAAGVGGDAPLRIDAPGRLELDVVLAPFGAATQPRQAGDPERFALYLPLADGEEGMPR